jgi:ABC-type microcin C transport system permease subunit YejB
LKSFFLIEGIIGGALVLLVVSLVSLLGIFTLPNVGIRHGIVVSSLLILATAIPGTLIGLLVFFFVGSRRRLHHAPFSSLFPLSPASLVESSPEEL